MNDTFCIDMEAWKNYVDEVQDALKTIACDPRCREALGEAFCTMAKEWNQRITEGRRTPFTIVVSGEFKRGKSSLINALLGEEIAPVDVTPETMTINTIRYGSHRNEAVLENGRRLLLTDEDIRRTNLSRINAEHDGKITHLMLYRPIELLRKVNIIDTPGLNETSGPQEGAARQAAEVADAVLYTFAPNSPLSMTEQLFLRACVLARTGIDLFLICNKSDTIEEEDQDTFRNWMDERVADILKGTRPYYVSALDEICRQNGLERPAPETADRLEGAMRALRSCLEHLIDERSQMAMPDRVEQSIKAMRSDIGKALQVMEQGAALSEKELEQAEEKMAGECARYEKTLARLTERAAEILGNARKETSRLTDEVLRLMRADARSLDGISNDDLIRYYPFFCMDRLQDSMDLCFAHYLSKVTDLLLEECGEDATRILDQRTETSLGITFHLDNQTWTRGDDIGFIGHQFDLGFLSYVIDGIAGAMRNKELRGKTSNILEQILAKYDGLGDEIQDAVAKTYEKLEKELTAKLGSYFHGKILETQDRMLRAKEISALGSKKKEQICSTAGYVRGLLHQEKEDLYDQ